MCVSVDARREWARKDTVGEMVRKTKCVTITANGKTCVISASGKKLGDVLWVNENLRMNSLKQVLKAWEALPAEERNLGKVELGEVDPARPLLRPPTGALVVAVFNRRFMRDDGDALRYLKKEDLNSGEGQNGWERIRESAQDMMWLPENEWREFLPKKLEKGASYAAPASFLARLFRFHLDPERGLGEGVTYGNSAPTDGKLMVTVDDVTADKVRLRLEGSAKLTRKPPGNGTLIIYEPSILGFVDVDRKSNSLSRFDLLAFGTQTNAPRGVLPGPQVLGIAFELVPNPTETQMVWPRGARDGLARYLAPLSAAK